MKNKYPIFIPTKNRYNTPYTIKAFEEIGVHYTAVVEEPEYEEYKKVVNKGDILVLPHRDKGLTATRNWIWDYAQNEIKTPYFWTFDDNIRFFLRFNKNRKWKMKTGSFLKAIEDFVQRYENLYIAGMQYEFLMPKRNKAKPYLLNHRVYSNMFIKTDIPYRNVTFYNDDTDLCLRILKDGYCTILFNAFLAEKIQTMIVKGGMTDHYEKQTEDLNLHKNFKEHIQMLPK